MEEHLNDENVLKAISVIAKARKQSKVLLAGFLLIAFIFPRKK